MAKSTSGASTPASVDGQEANGIKREASDDGNLAHEMSSTSVTAIKQETSASAHSSPSLSTTRIKPSRSSSSSSNANSGPDELDVKPKSELNGDASPAKVDMGKKPTRASNKAPPRVAPLFDHLPDATAEATSTFQVIESSTYQNKYLGFTESALECDCSEEWSESSYVLAGP